MKMYRGKIYFCRCCGKQLLEKETFSVVYSRSTGKKTSVSNGLKFVCPDYSILDMFNLFHDSFTVRDDGAVYED